MYEYKAKITRVVDGDTVDLLIDVGFNIHIKERARLYGIDAPESRTRDLEEKKRGLAAKARLIEILESFGETIVVRTSIDKGKYGRLLAELISEDREQNANQMLISEGHATEYFGGKKTK